MSNLISAPAQNEFLDMRTAGKDGDPFTFRMQKLRPTISWTNFFSNAYYILLDQTSSGTTAQRPTTRMYPGKQFFDTSLGAHGKVIFVNKDNSGWIDSSGNAV